MKGANLGGKGWPIVNYRTLVSCAKMAEQIKMLFGTLSGVGPGNHDGGPEPPCEEAILRGKRGGPL